MEESIFDETLPWGTLPYFIQERIYWSAMVHARNEMGWKALHEQLFPLQYDKLKCWDCGTKLWIMEPSVDLVQIVFPINGDFSGTNDFRCHQCQLAGRRRLYRVPYSHQGMFPRTDLPFYKVHVFGYLVDNIYRPRTYGYITHRLLTGYHISHAIITAKVLTRYYDEDNAYTRRYHIFRPIFLWNELRASFA